MRCPIDNETLVMTERNGVEIDYCPACRGVWLDRGELDKIIDRAAGAAPQRRDAPMALAEPVAPLRDRDRRDGDDRSHRAKRRESFLSELFDF